MRTVQELPRQFIRLPYPWEDGYRLSSELGSQGFLMEHGRRLKTIILSPPFLLASPFILLVVFCRAAVTAVSHTSRGNNQRNGLSFLSLVRKDVSRIVRKVYSLSLRRERFSESGTQREVEDFERGHDDAARIRSVSSGSEAIIIRTPSIPKSFWSVPLGIASIVIVGAGAVVVAAVMGRMGILAVPAAHSTATPNLSSSPSPTATTATPEPTPTPHVRRSTGSHRLTLADGDAADLDSMDPAWGVHDKPALRRGYDIQFADGGLIGRAGTEFAPVSGHPSYKTCINAIGSYIRDVYPGMQLCVRTNEKRLAFLTVKNVMKVKENTSQAFPIQIQLDVTVWDPPHE
jgi:hypothetical protein